jgi:ABC-type sugar transport system substrate-binding protein
VKRLVVAVLLLLVTARAAAADPLSLAARNELKRERAHRRAVRNAGYMLVGGGVALGAASGLALEMGKRAGDSIQFGGFDTAADIEARAEQARRYKVASWCLAGAGAAMALTGLTLALTHPDPRSPRIEASPVAGGAIVGVSGVLP